jgi:hypothetical protein
MIRILLIVGAAVVCLVLATLVVPGQFAQAS